MELVNYSDKSFKNIVKDELKHIFSISVGVITSQLLSVLMMTTDVIFVGHLGSQYLAASSLASSYSWVTGFVSYALCLGMDSLIPQAIGANNKKMVGQVLQTSLWVTTIATIPVGLSWWFSKYLLALYIKDNDELIELFSTFNRLLLPGLIPLSIFTVLRNFCEMQQLVKPSLIVSLIGVLLNILFNWIFIHFFGYIGAPIATSVSRFVLCISMFGYIYLSKIYKPFWSGWTLDALKPKNVLTFLRFGVVGMLTTVLEVAGFEVTVLMSAVFGDVVISAHAIAFQINVLMYQFGVGFSRAITTRCGTYLGERNLYMSKLSCWIGIILTIIVTVFFNILIFSFRNYIGYIFSDEEDVVELAGRIFRLLVFCTTFDSLNMSLTGIFRGVGRPGVSSVGNLIGFWAVSFPICYYLAFKKDLGVFGFWWGLLSGLSFIIVVEIIYLFTLNWPKLADETQERTKQEEEIKMEPEETSSLIK